ncbi:hypothetical protein ACW7BC_22165 [Azospirillum argentinense]
MHHGGPDGRDIGADLTSLPVRGGVAQQALDARPLLRGLPVPLAALGFLLTPLLRLFPLGPTLDEPGVKALGAAAVAHFALDDDGSGDGARVGLDWGAVGVPPHVA